MGVTFWVWTWILLVVFALVLFALIAKSLFNKLLSAAHQLERITTKLERLFALLDEKPSVQRPEDSLLADQGLVLARRKALLKAKIKKQEQRQRRLIASLKRFDPNESRFH